ncbi:hypothetical protein BLA29_015081 [Euroglyphus maynei]|uniref:Uncharacterized protein n=1 Tax=Euroglyphus maynei TaxID=6958 RepID=A0A1Y3B735_EURMA|nr:hypothetical protein BLA29_015081 [Euroglyphus maynei]
MIFVVELNIIPVILSMVSSERIPYRKYRQLFYQYFSPVFYHRLHSVLLMNIIHMV